MKERTKPAEIITLSFIGIKITLKNPGAISFLILLLVFSFLLLLVWSLKGQMVDFSRLFKSFIA